MAEAAIKHLLEEGVLSYTGRISPYDDSEEITTDI
jgi:hypothetical protein